LTIVGVEINRGLGVGVRMERRQRVVVIGAGLVAALRLAAAGIEVTVLERAARPGGKMRSVSVAGRPVEAGPTVFTMRWVFEEVFAEAGARLAERVRLSPAGILARHAWNAGERLDLFADIDTSAEAISAIAGGTEAEGYRRFCARAAEVYRTLEGPFIRSERPSPIDLGRRVGLSGIGDLWCIQPFATLWGHSAITSAIPGSASSSDATPPIAGPRPSRRPPP
jgi:1-hydroxycarotenoid 3,4-desaturase